MTLEELNNLTYTIRGAVFYVYNALGPGLMECLYERALLKKLRNQGLKAESQVPIPVEFDGEIIGDELRADIVVNDYVIVELKAVEQLQGLHFRQLVSYLRLARKPLGLLVNFGAVDMNEGIKRVLNGRMPLPK